MPLSPEDRNRLVALLPELGPAGDRARFVQTAAALGPAALEEIGELPGLEPLRAAMLRVLPELADDLEPWLEAADEALEIYPTMAREEDPMLSLARHPAWVGLAVLELASLRDEDGHDRALTLTTVGFDGQGGVAPGEVLWAMAEQAEEVGWTARSASLLERAAAERFEDEAHRGEVRLLLGLRWAEDGRPEAVDVLQAVVEARGPAQRKVHAAWVLAALVRSTEPQRAIRVLAEALAILMAEAEPDPTAVQRIREALAALGAPDLPSA